MAMTTVLKPFRIGSLEIGFPVILAPMAGYTDLAYRMICRDMGVEYCVTEMLLDRMVAMRARLKIRLLRMAPGDHPVAGQIVGCEPADMVAATKVLGEMGFDVIDLNFACPVRKALARHRGGYMMKVPDQTIEVIRAVTAVADRPVTVKLRQKFRRADDDSTFWRVAEAAFDAGVAAICVHARSVQQMYSGPADWEFLAEVKRHFPDKVIIGSGDVLKPQRALDMLEQTGVDAVSAARGALGNPWFFQQVRDLAAGREAGQPSPAEQRAVLLRHFTDACELYGEQRGAKHMRGFGIRYARLNAHPKALRIAFVEVKTPEQWREVLDKFYPPQ